MRRALLVLVFALCPLLTACSSGGVPAAAAEPLTAQEFVENCVVSDLQDLAGLLQILQSFGQDGADIPTPELNLLQLLIDGTIGWSIDVDDDGSTDLNGTIGFTDAAGASTIPFDVSDFLSGGTPDIADLLSGLPDGTTLNLTFLFNNLTALAQAGGGSGTLSFLFNAGVISSANGSGIFDTENCSFNFGFDDIRLFDPSADEFPDASLTFSVDVDGQVLGGDIELDGTNIARIVARPTGGAVETFLLDLATGLLIDG